MSLIMMVATSRSFAPIVLIEDDFLNDIGVFAGIQLHDVISYWPAPVVNAPPSNLNLPSSPPRDIREDSPTSSHVRFLEVAVDNKVF